MTYRDVDALAQRDAIEARLGTTEGDERAQLANDLHALDTARRRAAKRHLPAIARARIATPCGERWETMIGQGAIRSCTRCDREVFDVARMTLAEAEALVGPDACARLHVRADGTMLFADCEVGAEGIRTRRTRLAATAIALAGLAAASITDSDVALAVSIPSGEEVNVRFGELSPAPVDSAPDALLMGLMTPASGDGPIVDLIAAGQPTSEPLRPRASRSRRRPRRPDRPDR